MKDTIYANSQGLIGDYRNDPIRENIESGPPKGIKYSKKKRYEKRRK